MRQTIAAMNDLDQAVTTVGGIALRYGSFYGDPIDPLVTAVRARKWPIGGDGGVWSYITSRTPPFVAVPAAAHGGGQSDRRRDGQLVLSTVAAATSVGLTQAILSGRHGGFSISHPGVLPGIAGPAFVALVRALIGMGIGAVIRHVSSRLRHGLAG
jgi:hypothetical protein